MRVHGIFAAYDTSSLVNVIVPLNALKEQGSIIFETRTENEVTPDWIAQADIIVTERTIDPTYKPIYEFAHMLHIPIIYDLDDDLFEVPRESVLYRYYNNPPKLAQLEWMLRTSERVRVHSPVLQDIVSQYTSQISLVWGAIDWSLVPDKLPVLSNNQVEIVYAATSYSGSMFFSLVLPDILRLLDHYGDRIRLHCLGYNPPELRYHPQVVFGAFEQNYQKFFSDFVRYGYAIGLAPMLQGRFYQSKTNIKFRDYAASGAAGVYTDCPLYRNGVVHRQTGMLVSGEPGSWFKAISELIENPELLENIRVNARKFAEEKYNLEKVASLWEADLLALPPRPLLSANENQVVEKSIWWFNRPRKSRSQFAKQMLSIYHKRVPFRLHVFFSKCYHILKRITSI